MRGSIPGYFGRTFYAAIELWRRWKRFGLPFWGLGWAETPDFIVRTIEAIDEEMSRG